MDFKANGSPELISGALLLFLCGLRASLHLSGIRPPPLAENMLTCVSDGAAGDRLVCSDCPETVELLQPSPHRQDVASLQTRTPSKQRGSRKYCWQRLPDMLIIVLMNSRSDRCVLFSRRLFYFWSWTRCLLMDWLKRGPVKQRVLEAKCK